MLIIFVILIILLVIVIIIILLILIIILLVTITNNNQIHNVYQYILQLYIVFRNNLSFSTLALGFYIISSDIWMKISKKYHHNTINNNIKNNHNKLL